jgi:GNAT superfamily N-acetyltransferase
MPPRPCPGREAAGWRSWPVPVAGAVATVEAVEVTELLAQHRDEAGRLLKSVGLGRTATRVLSGRPARELRLVAIDGGEVVGFIEGHLDATGAEPYPEGHCPPFAWVRQMVVDRRRRRRGVGRLLLAAFGERAMATGCTFLALQVAASPGARGRRAFFRSCGLRWPVTGHPRSARVMGAAITDMTRG